MKTKHYTVPASASGDIKVDASQGPLIVDVPSGLRKSITIIKVDDSDNEVVVRTDGRETIVFGG